MSLLKIIKITNNIEFLSFKYKSTFIHTDTNCLIEITLTTYTTQIKLSYVWFKTRTPFWELTKTKNEKNLAFFESLNYDFH